MLKPKKQFSSPEEIKQFVLECEADFERRLDLAVTEIGTGENLKIIGLSGPTCSGKTTLSKKLVANFNRLGRDIHTISIDNFYLSRDYLIERSKRLGLKNVDYDSVETINLEELRECIREISTDDETLVPIYDFKSGSTVGFERIEYSESELFVFEGIQVVYPEISALLREYPYRSMIICPMSDIDYGDVRFEPNEIRLMRRLVRDAEFRGTSPSKTFEMWQGVRENEDKNIFPYINDCDVKINSVIPYEMNILAPYLRRLLPTVERENVGYEVARTILEKIADIQGISPEYIGENALYHEFVG